MEPGLSRPVLCMIYSLTFCHYTQNVQQTRCLLKIVCTRFIISKVYSLKVLSVLGVRSAKCMASGIKYSLVDLNYSAFDITNIFFLVLESD